MKSAIGHAGDLDYSVFVRRVAEKTGIDLGSYKRKQMERRLRSLAQGYGTSSLLEFYDLLERDAEVLDQFRRRMTINVSELFRNPDKFEELRRNMLPGLLRTARRPKVWSAGCSHGAEAYSVAILLRELGAAEAWILGTDIDEDMLARAREGRFSEADMKNVSPLRRRRFFRQDGRWHSVRPELRHMVQFRHHDLLRDRCDKGFHLILCRNVVIYFTEEAKDRLYPRLYESLAPGGVLFTGSTERISRAQRLGFESLSGFFYRRPVEPGR